MPLHKIVIRLRTLSPNCHELTKDLEGQQTVVRNKLKYMIADFKEEQTDFVDFDVLTKCFESMMWEP